MPGLPLQDCPRHPRVGQDVPHLFPNHFDLNRSANLCRESANHFFKKLLSRPACAEMPEKLVLSCRQPSPRRLSTMRLRGVDRAREPLAAAITASSCVGERALDDVAYVGRERRYRRGPAQLRLGLGAAAGLERPPALVIG